MREYLVKEGNPHHLPKAVYYQALYAVRDYDRLRAEYRDVLAQSLGSGGDGQPRGGAPGRPTQRKAEKLAEISEKIDAIDRALAEIPPEYRKAVFENVKDQKPYPYIASPPTWSRWRRKFLYEVAKNLRLIRE